MNIRNQPKYVHPLQGSRLHSVIPGKDPEFGKHPLYLRPVIYALDSGSLPGMTECDRLLGRGCKDWADCGYSFFINGVEGKLF